MLRNPAHRAAAPSRKYCRQNCQARADRETRAVAAPTTMATSARGRQAPGQHRSRHAATTITGATTRACDSPVPRASSASSAPRGASTSSSPSRAAIRMPEFTQAGDEFECCHKRTTSRSSSASQARGNCAEPVQRSASMLRARPATVGVSNNACSGMSSAN